MLSLFYFTLSATTLDGSARVEAPLSGILGDVVTIILLSLNAAAAAVLVAFWAHSTWKHRQLRSAKCREAVLGGIKKKKVNSQGYDELELPSFKI